MARGAGLRFSLVFWHKNPAGLVLGKRFRPWWSGSLGLGCGSVEAWSGVGSRLEACGCGSVSLFLSAVGILAGCGPGACSVDQGEPIQGVPVFYRFEKNICKNNYKNVLSMIYTEFNAVSNGIRIQERGSGVSKEEILVYRFEKVIDAPIEVVFDWLNNDEKIKLWNTTVVENIYESEELKPGTRYQSVQKIGNMTYTIHCVLTEYDPPYKAVAHTETKEGTSITKYFLSEENNKTRLTIEASIVPSNFIYKTAAKLLGKKAAQKLNLNEQYERLVKCIEKDINH